MLWIVMYNKFDMFVNVVMFFVLFFLTGFSGELMFSHELSTTTETMTEISPHRCLLSYILALFSLHTVMTIP